MSVEAQLREGLAGFQRREEVLSGLHIVFHLALLLAGSNEPSQRAEALALVSGFEPERLIFLRKVPENARVLELARERWDERS